jgi:predicted adenine nucleotide alpha hydrolase (AANH) superfamily ATPase
MNLLLHICCGPCAAYPLDFLRRQGGCEVTGWFHNPNIHPYKEFRRRIEALEEFARQKDFRVEIDRSYGLRDFLRRVVFHEDRDERCGLCYEMRLLPAARRAAEQGFDAFTSTLLYSKYQNHGLLKSMGESSAAQTGSRFLYHDFREGWQQGVDESIAMGLYRQPYCGCIYSEQERYDKACRPRR